MGNVTLPAPNMKVRVTKGGASAGQSAWVQLFEEMNGGTANHWRRWIGSSSTDLNGYASFNIDSGTVSTFAVQVFPAGGSQSNYADALYEGSGYSGLTFDQVNGQSFELAVPNLKVVVRAPVNGSYTLNKWGWFYVEQIDTSTSNSIGWLNGYGLDYSGSANIKLSSNGAYRISAYPAGGKGGAFTKCDLTVSDSGTVSTIPGKCGQGTISIPGQLNLDLLLGNIVGTVKKLSDSSPIANAIVYANLAIISGTSATISTDDTTAVITSTDSTGKYGLQLDPSKQWLIRIIPTTAGLAVTDCPTIIYPPGVGAQSLDISVG